MLVIIVSLGFGVIKPRLGPMLHRIVGVGALFFILASIEAFIRVDSAFHDMANRALIFTEVIYKPNNDHFYLSCEKFLNLKKKLLRF